MQGRIVDMNEARKSGESVLIAMSGGVDSAVAALLVKEAGFRAVGLTMKNYCYGDADVPDRSCCSVEAIHDARRECDRLGIPHRVVDVEDFFTHEVVDNFLSEYQEARTPNPCVRCNSIVRFSTLIDHADRFGIDYVATGHYARIFEMDNGERYLARSTNRRKDQSYFLSGVHGETLGRMLFPLGDYDKETVRGVASDASIAVADKKESQEVCFVPDGTLRSFLDSKDVALLAGPIENTEGEVLGQHEGLASYTVGQRRHLGIAAGRPQYVVRLDRERNTLVVGDEDELMSGEFMCTFQWLDPQVRSKPLNVRAQIRYHHEPTPVTDIFTDGRKGRVQFESPQRAVCPGQTVVFFRDDIVVGSGVIDAAGPA